MWLAYLNSSLELQYGHFQISDGRFLCFSLLFESDFYAKRVQSSASHNVRNVSLLRVPCYECQCHRDRLVRAA